MAEAVGTRRGIVGGQAWEKETNVDLEQYHRAKSAALFSGATMAGAAAAGLPHREWRALGDHLGAAYQVADDIADATGSAEELGKPVGQDVTNERPNAVQELGLLGASRRAEELVNSAIAAIPDCPERESLSAWFAGVARKLCSPRA